VRAALVGVPLLVVLASLELLQARDPGRYRRPVLLLHVAAGVLLVMFTAVLIFRVRSLL
jgi:hypothetical protein